MGTATWTTGVLVWIGIVLCVSQAAIFSGLNLAIFSISRLRLEVEADGGSRAALALLDLRRDANFTLATVLWGNVGVNVLLTLLSNSVLTGVGAFLFSTVVITVFCEITPQAYFARHALRLVARLRPLLKVYGVILYPVAKTTALLLDRWLGPEAITFFRERDFRALIMKHVEAADADVSSLEGRGALNFLDLDDILVVEEGEPIDPLSVLTLPAAADGRPQLPRFECAATDPFLRRLNASGRKWVIVTDPSGVPQMVLNAHHFLRDALFDGTHTQMEAYWHRPIVITDPHTRLGDVIGRLKVHAEHLGDDVIDNDLLLVWSPHQRRIITGADLLGRLLRGIARREPVR